MQYLAGFDKEELCARELRRHCFSNIFCLSRPRCDPYLSFSESYVDYPRFASGKANSFPLFDQQMFLCVYVYATVTVDRPCTQKRAAYFHVTINQRQAIKTITWSL